MSQISSSKTQSIVNAVNSNIHAPLIALILLIFENQRQSMTKDAIPYICGGTFLAQVLRARANRKTPTDYTNGQKESLSESETFDMYPLYWTTSKEGIFYALQL